METLYCGLTSIKITKKTINVEHSGNMGNTIQGSIKPNVDKLLGKGSFNKLLENQIEQKGSADYFYVLKAKNVL